MIRRKYKLFKKNFEVYKNEIFIFPTIRIFANNLIYTQQNFSLEFHFLIFHIRLLFLKDNLEKGYKS